LADYCAETIWRPAGMEANGYWVLEAQEMGGFGVSARLRDVGRFGLLVLEDGEAFNGRRSCRPAGATSPASPTARPRASVGACPGSPMGYGYHWWALPHLPTGIHAGAFLAIGAFGQ
jgi:CubicO group peptidase (beta-lactamase class C family)